MEYKLVNPSSEELRDFISNSKEGVYAQYFDRGIVFFLRDKVSIEDIHKELNTRSEIRPLCMIITPNYKMRYTDKYDGIGVRNLSELAYMYNYLKTYKFLDQNFIDKVYKGIRYAIDIRDNHPKRKEAAQIIGDHPLLRKFFNGTKIALKTLIPILGSLAILYYRRKKGWGWSFENLKGDKMNNTQLIESLEYHTQRINEEMKPETKNRLKKAAKIGAGLAVTGAAIYGGKKLGLGKKVGDMAKRARLNKIDQATATGKPIELKKKWWRGNRYEF